MMHVWRILRQALLPSLLLAGAVASLVYGAVYHFVPVERNVVVVEVVQEEHEEWREDPFAGPAPGMTPGGPGFQDPGIGPLPDVLYVTA